MSTLLQQETQIRASLTADRDDTIAPSEANFETNPVSLLDDINNICSQLSNLMDGQAGDWFTDLVTPSALDTGTQRGVNDLNTGLHAVEKKRVLREVVNIVPVTVGGTDDFVVLGVGELPAQLIAAVGAVTTLGTVVAFHTGTFGTHSLDEVAGSSAVSPLNLVGIVDDVTHDPILSGGNKIYGLLQSEVITDGHTINTTTQEVQISFVRINGAGNDLEAVPAADIQGKVIHYFPIERVRLEDLNEQDFLGGGIVDVPAGTTVSRQATYDNQGTTPVDVTTNSTLDLEGPGLSWQIRDDLEAMMFELIEGSAGGTSQVNIGAAVDEFDVDAVVNDFLNGASFDTGAAGTTIDIGVTAANQITSGGNLVAKAAGDLRFSDQYEPAGWSEDGIQLSDAAQTWTDFETEFGEVGLMDAIIQAKNTSGRRRVVAYATANVAVATDVSGPANDNNLDANLGDLSGGTFIDDYDVIHNGQYLDLDAAVAGAGDVYPGTSLANGQLRFNRKIKSGDNITIVDYVA
jgi:hypothetical protein